MRMRYRRRGYRSRVARRRRRSARSVFARRIGNRF